MQSTPDAGSPRAVAVTFAVPGLLNIAALSRMPSIRGEIGATSAQLSLALVCMGIGAVLAMPFTGRLTERFSSAATVRAASGITIAAWVAVGFVHNVPSLAVCLLFVGAGNGVWDVAMNVQGHTVEQRQARVLMPKWHAVFSFGSVAGALVGAGAARGHVDIRWQYLVLGAVSAVLLAWSTARFVGDAAERDVEPAADLAAVVTKGFTRTELLIGLIMFGTALGEGAANDWLGLTLVDDRHVAEAFGAVALAGFNLTMAAGRLGGAGLIEKYGRVAVLRASGVTACAGVLLLCFVASPVTALIGAGAWGLGLAVVFPSGISAAGELPGRGPRAISTVATIGYGGFLCGAPTIGQLTRFVPLDRALLAVAVMAAMIAVLAPAARERSRDTVAG